VIDTPLLEERPTAAQVTLAIIVPAIYGAITGYVLGHSKAVYSLLGLLAALGGIAAGYEHVGAAEGARRGALGGTIFGAAIVIAHAIQGGAAKASIPSPAVLLVVVTAVFGILLGALGGYLRGRTFGRAAGQADLSE
jgi:hypothetical protein